MAVSSPVVTMQDEMVRSGSRRMDHALNLQTRLENMKKRKIACDFKIRVEDGSCVAVHRALLIATSKYFENLFSSESKEVQDGYILVKDLTIEGIELCIEYLYTGDIQITSSNVQSTLDVANSWQLDGLVQICSQYLKDGISPQKEKILLSQETAAGPLTLVMLDEGTGVLTALNVEEGGHRNIGHRRIADAPNFRRGDFVKVTSIDGELHLLQNKKFYKYLGQNWILKARLGDQPGLFAQLVTSHSQDKVYLISKNTMVTYNVSNEIWSDPLPGSGLGMDVCLAASPDSIYAIGGLWDWRNTRRFDPDSERWLTVKTKKYGRRGAAATFYQDKIYVMGGATVSAYKKNVECYDPSEDKWTDLADMNKPRAWLAAAVYNDRLYAIGGWPERDTIEVYNQDLNRWEEKEDIPNHEGKISVCVCNL